MILNGCSFSTVGLFTLIRVRKDTPQVISDKATAKIRDTIFRLGRLLSDTIFGFILLVLLLYVDWEGHPTLIFRQVMSLLQCKGYIESCILDYFFLF